LNGRITFTLASTCITWHVILHHSQNRLTVCIKNYTSTGDTKAM